MNTQSFGVGSQCKKYGLTIWQCPQFLFLVMGVIIIVSMVVAYFVGQRYISNPLFVALIIIFLALVLFIISYVITQGFEKLAEASRMKSEFVSIVSHQLRSPLTNLKWTLDLLSDNDIGEKRDEYYKILKENSLRMEELIDNLLVVSRIEQGKFPAKKEELSIEELIEKSVKGLEQFAQASGIKVVLDIEEGLPRVMADKFQLGMILDNILNNAIRYTKKQGEVAIRLAKKGGKLFCSVEDTGIGIPKEDQKFIFQKFFRARNAQQHQTQGTGLGLYIAERIAKNFGGKIGFFSQENKGSTFWFTLSIK
jgi:signal transduction histidine kinase